MDNWPVGRCIDFSVSISYVINLDLANCQASTVLTNLISASLAKLKNEGLYIQYIYYLSFFEMKIDVAVELDSKLKE